MIICLNQHFICSFCADNIAESNSNPKCPFCQKLFNIEKIKPRLINQLKYENLNLITNTLENVMIDYNDLVTKQKIQDK
jgi:hypothetical protein